MLLVGHRANTQRWLRRHLACTDVVEVDVVDESGTLRGGHVGPAGAPLLLRERIGRAIEGLRFTPSPPLRALLSWLPLGARVMLDLKDPVEPGRLLGEVRSAGLDPGAVYVSTRWHNLSPRLSSMGFRVLLSIDCRPHDPAGLVSAAAAAGVAVRYSYLDPGFVEELHRGGYVVAAWTVNTPAALRRVAGLGVDLVVTDAPCRLRRWLRGG